jgi:hypothetical protein
LFEKETAEGLLVLELRKWAGFEPDFVETVEESFDSEG